MDENKTYNDRLIVAIEGSDGTGKHTQAERLLAYYFNTKNSSKYTDSTAMLVSFPAYNCGSSYFVKKFLQGEYANIYPNKSDLDIKLICDMYAMDQFDYWFTEDPNNPDPSSFKSLTSCNDMYENGTTMILDRSWISNIIYQSVRLFISVLHNDKEMPEDIESLIVKAFEYAKTDTFYNMKSWVKLPYLKYNQLDFSDILIRYKKYLKSNNIDVFYDISYIVGALYNATRLVLSYVCDTSFIKMKLPVPNIIINLGFRDYSIGKSLLENRDGEKDKNESNANYMALVNYLSPFILNFMTLNSFFTHTRIYQVYSDVFQIESKDYRLATMDEVTKSMIDVLTDKGGKKNEY